MNIASDCAIITWSEGPASFERYLLEGMNYGNFEFAAREAREKLANVVKDFVHDPKSVPASAYELADCGFKLYKAILKPKGDQGRKAKKVRDWLEKLADQQEVDTLEIVSASPWTVPWNIVYDKEPCREAFLTNDEALDRWRPFWGLRYNLSGGRQVDPLRRVPILNEPRVLLVVDEKIRAALPAEQVKRLNAFAAKHNLTIVRSKAKLKEAIKAGRPELLYWLSHANAEALVLDREEISPRDLGDLLEQDEEVYGGLAFLNACQTAEAGKSGSFFEALHNAGYSGMIGTEHQTVDQFANPLGLDFLEAFLERGEPVGMILRTLRGRVPLGLLYGTYCPPDIRVKKNSIQDNLEIRQELVQGIPLSAQQPTSNASNDDAALPDEPYRFVASYNRSHRALFAGRDSDVNRFATILDNAETRIIILHGECGVGKSSFLSAGLIPFLEDECVGYRFLRHSQADDEESTVIFVRATNDLFRQIAYAICQYCAQPFEYKNPLGEELIVDLPRVLREFAGGRSDHTEVSRILKEDLCALGRLLAAIGKVSPFTTILVIDQGEEIFTLAGNQDELEQGRSALDMLRQLVKATGEFKVIFALRTEYYGRVIDRLRRGLTDANRIREYLLTDLSPQLLCEAIRLPTSDKPVSYSSQIPFEKYRFRFEDGVVERIVEQVVHNSMQGQNAVHGRDSALPLMQVICSQLYQLANLRDDRTIYLNDLVSLGGIEGAMQKHVDDLLSEFGDDKRLVKKLFTTLYLKQSDGSVTTALLPQEDVRHRWKGTMPIEDVFKICRKYRLLRFGKAGDRPYVSLGHDSLAKLAAIWHNESVQREQIRKRLRQYGKSALKILGIAAPLILGCWVMLKSAEQEGKIDRLLTAAPDGVQACIAASKPFSKSLLPKLKDIMQDQSQDVKRRFRAALGIAALTRGDKIDTETVKFLIDQVRTSDGAESYNLISAMRNHPVKAREELIEALKVDRLTKKDKFRLATCLMSCWKSVPQVIDLLNAHGDPQQRTDYIRHYKDWAGDISVISNLIGSNQGQSDFDSGLCLAIGSLDNSSLQEEEISLLTTKLQNLYTESSDTGTHSAAYWAYRKITGKSPNDELLKSSDPDLAHWYINSIGATMLLLPAGASNTDTAEFKVESFYLCDREVTEKQFKKYLHSIGNPHRDPEKNEKDPYPAQKKSWTMAIQFCNWLSQEEQLEAYYEKAEEKWKFNESANGYRLPTAAEWEYACRAGTTTTYCFGSSIEDLSHYAVFDSKGGPEACCSKRPNAWGFFDMHGNVAEWCFDSHMTAGEELHRICRGGAYSMGSDEVSSGSSQNFGEDYIGGPTGFRIARNATKGK